MKINLKKRPYSTENEKTMFYALSDLSEIQVVELLENPPISGVFGLELMRVNGTDRTQLFSPLFYKLPFEETAPHLFSFDLENTEEITVAQFYMEKTSVFPLEFHATHSMWSLISPLLPDKLDVFYQWILAYRHDDWQSDLQEQYLDFIGGIEQPSNSRFFRKIQRNVNEKLNRLVSFEFNHHEIKEVEEKLSEHGYRYNFRIALNGLNEPKRTQIVSLINQKLNEHSYMNHWQYSIIEPSNILPDMVHRKLNKTAQKQILCTSELTPYLHIPTSLSMLESVSLEEKSSVSLTPATSLSTELASLPTEASTSGLSNVTHLIDYLPVGKDLQQVDGDKISSKFSHALKELKGVDVKLTPKLIQSGANMMKITYTMPKGIKLSDLTNKQFLENAQVYLGLKNIQVKQGENFGEFALFVPLEKRQKVFLRNYIESDEFRKFSRNNPLPVMVGIDEIGSPIFRDLTQAKHILIGGSTGSGKSVFMNTLLLTILLFKKPQDVIFYMIDVKQVELTMYEAFPHVMKIETDAVKGIALLQQIVNEMNDRYELFKDAQVKNIQQYNKKYRHKAIPYIVVCIDEYAELSGRDDRVHEYVQSLSQLARASGIVLILATQDPRKDVLPPIIKSNMPSKIGLKCSNEHAYLTFLRKKPPKLLGYGDGVMEFENQADDFIRFQSCMITDGDEVDLIKKIAAGMKDQKMSFALPEVEEIEEESEIDQMKRVIATTGETRLKELRTLLGMNQIKASELLKQLAEEGFLTMGPTRKDGYQITASEEELAEYKETSTPE